MNDQHKPASDDMCHGQNTQPIGEQVIHGHGNQDFLYFKGLCHLEDQLLWQVAIKKPEEDGVSEGAATAKGSIYTGWKIHRDGR